MKNSITRLSFGSFFGAILVVLFPISASAGILGTLQSFLFPERLSCNTILSQNLKLKDKGPTVVELQKILNISPETRVATSGPGSPGNETDYFGPLTQKAVVKLQEKYADDVLKPVGLSKGTGFFGAKSRAKTEEICVALSSGMTKEDLTAAAIGGFKSLSYVNYQSFKRGWGWRPSPAPTPTPIPTPVPPPTGGGGGGSPAPTPVPPPPSGGGSSPAPAPVPPTPDTSAPSIPNNPAAYPKSATQVAVTWATSTDNIAVTGYKIYRCAGTNCTASTQVGTATIAYFWDGALTASTNYRYRVRSFDAAGNVSDYSAHDPVTTSATPAPVPPPPPPVVPPPAPDTVAPTTPANLSANSGATTQVSLAWSASTDAVGVTGYYIYRCQGSSCTASTQVGTASTTAFLDTGRSANTAYRYRVRATDVAGNLSAYSSHTPVTTMANPTPPPAPVPPPAPTPTPPVSGEIRINKVYNTFYTWHDNTPPGSSEIAFAKSDGFPTAHNQAGGAGTYTDPITVAVGHVITNGQSTPDYPVGTMFYSPYLGKYGIAEDLCGDGNTPQNIPCHNISTADSGATTWLDWWMDGRYATVSNSNNCAEALTANHLIIQNPAPNYRVVVGSIMPGTSCPASLGDTVITN